MTTSQSASLAPAPASLQQYQRQFVRHLRNPDADTPPEGVPAARIGVYVELLYNKIEDSLLACFPMVRKLLGQDRWQRLAREFIARHRCASPFYRQIPDEFIAYLQNERAEPDDPPLLLELAHYEWMELVLTLAEGEPNSGAFDPDGDLLAGIPVFAPVIALLRYRYPVHQIGPEPILKSGEMAPGATPFFILGFRDIDDEVRFIEISAATARLIAWLQEGGSSGSEALLRLAEKLRHPDGTLMISFGADLLRNLRQQGAILGTKTSKLPTEFRSRP
ncbi:DNA-binding domain-containing protein [Methylocaldum sp.]|uniref:HvfC family RiPP maturation protein n=1 Tax=Methylocaldum sp. TaxID=1969727 RepID=UPI002D6C7ED9|nr:putative DNA-binding domain-containing protein [Methylocaldum sp.]HYE35689.1 putative DNA-binding domain-containing protein [Methylocaldum sp.]